MSRTRGILGTLPIYCVKLYHVKIPDTFKILVYLEPQTYSEYRESLHLKTRGIFRTLPNLYNGAFYSDPCVTLANLEPWYILNLRNIQNLVMHQ